MSDFLRYFFRDIDDGLQLSYRCPVFAYLIDELQTFGIRLHIAIFFDTSINLRFGEASISECELPTNAKEISGSSLESSELLLKEIDSFLIIGAYAPEEITFDLGPFEDDTHDEVVHILILYQLSALVSCQLLQTIHLSHNAHHQLNENRSLIYNTLILVCRQLVEVSTKCRVEWLKEAAVRVFLEDLCPFEEKPQGLGVLLAVDIRTVYYVDLHYQRLVLLHVILEGVCRVVLSDLLLLLASVSLVLEDETGTPDLLFQIFRSSTHAL